ncbi:MAG: hypothetical protein ACD_75C01435G0001 [uncultured bacterium]|nr:MAG: hypothetical protein ACD_75C01435G0001 [uncultured bacterium]
MQIAPGPQTGIAVFAHAKGGKGDDRHPAPLFHPLVFPDRSSGRQAIHHRHLDIHEDKVVFGSLRLFDRNAAVFRRIYPEWHLFEILFDDHSVMSVILDQEQAGRAKVNRGKRAGRSGCRRVRWMAGDE